MIKKYLISISFMTVFIAIPLLAISIFLGASFTIATISFVIIISFILSFVLMTTHYISTKHLK